MKANKQQFENRFLRAHECATYLGIGISTFWLWVNQDKFPKGTKFSSRVTVWRLSDIQAFAEKHIGIEQ
jgi:predicted DNA-binding transcriptional regulator AlpA